MKKNLLALICFYALFWISPYVGAQNIISCEEGYANNIGITVSMLNELKDRITNMVEDLDQEETDFLLDEDANTVGAMILHLAATEAHYQVFTFENRRWNKEEQKQWGIPMSLGKNARKQLKGKPISYYLDIWTEVREKTLELLKTKDDVWLQESPARSSMNNHWAWFHVMEHQANHMGQIALILKRM